MTLDKPWKVLIACGTGTTAAYVHERLIQITDGDIQVLAIPCVGNRAYLGQQMAKIIGNTPLPLILNPSIEHAFGKPRKELLEIWREIRDPHVNLEFDLLYAPRAFEVIFDNLHKPLLEYSNFLYYHCGGVEGNESQMKRYERIVH